MSDRRDPIRLPGLGLEAARAAHRERVRGLFAKVGVKPMESEGPLPADLLIVVELVATFNPADNALWTDPANRSFPRDLHCRTCGGQVVMSRAMFEAYSTRGGHPDMITCSGCVPQAVTR